MSQTAVSPAAISVLPMPAPAAPPIGANAATIGTFIADYLNRRSDGKAAEALAKTISAPLNVRDPEFADKAAAVYTLINALDEALTHLGFVSHPTK